ncbi:DUF2894 domain-containing protein [Luteibacter jiangsuensis]|uniref:DUF2894 domain-containing protein n=1 Tax=Luteibacter jiangsuensis TaxID=637577 RepID=A0ABX0Q365_9GAMM|nr:DUF2894 domain-containing protein [Luteibacter jiangsuensis]
MAREQDKAGTCAERPRGPLGRLVDELAGSAQASAYPELPALGEFQKIWSRVRAESQLRQSLEDTPENAGPLNSSALVHRSMALMRETAPGYLRHFLSYIDDLSWLERLGEGKAAVTATGQTAASIGKRPKSPKARKSRAKPPG